MDLNSIETVVRPADRAALPTAAAGDAYLAGGTWLFSEPQPGLRRLVDLQALGWPAFYEDEGGIEIAATCTLGVLEAAVASGRWPAAPMVIACCHALLGSFKIRSVATVGGNLCLALPASPMSALVVALDGLCEIWSASGVRCLPAREFITGPQRTALGAGEVLRAVHLPAAALLGDYVVRRHTLTPLGRSAALLVGQRAGAGFSLTITAAVARPVRLDFAVMPDAARLAAAIEAAVPGWYDDLHGAPEWRRHVTLLAAGEIRDELACG